MKRIPLFLCALTAFGVGLASCAPATALAQPTEVATKVAPTTTTATPTKTPIPPTPTPEATDTAEAPFVAEGFAIAEGGLLKNPETGKNILAMNPEADWEKVREGIIGGLWQANMDWYQYTGQSSDALNYSTKEEFIKAAKEGKVLRIGIPVRDDITKINEEAYNYYKMFGTMRATGITLHTVEIKLDSIQVQLLDPSAFKEYTGGKDWLADDQEAFALRHDDKNSGNGALLFGVNEEGRLIISVGSYYFGDGVAAEPDLEIGRFGDVGERKYPLPYREDGLGVKADKALSLYFASMADWLNFFPAGEGWDLGKDGSHIKGISMLKTVYSAGVWEMDGWYLDPPVFVFAK